MDVKISVAELEYLAGEGEVTTQDGVKLALVEEGEWVGGGKYEDKDVVFTDGERFYRGTISRSGSYFSDYTYNSEWDDGDAEIEEVAKVPVTKYEWEAVIERGFHVYETEYPSEGSYCVSDVGLADLVKALRDGDNDAPDSDFVTVLGPAVQTQSGWHPLDDAKEAD